MRRNSAILPDQFATLGELLKYLRRRVGLTQRELAIAVGYSDTQISRIEQNQRVPDQATLNAQFVPALELEHELAWVARLVELAVEAHRDEAAVPHPSGSPTPAHNLPLQLTSFIGREKEIAEIKRLLVPLSTWEKEQRVRLVTLVGSGGVGKTRLSLRVAQELLSEYADGVWLVELAPLADPALVPQTVATVLGVREEPGRPWLTALTDYLREKTLLLVLDNCEHVIEFCAQLAEHVLQHCPNLRLLASSREALRVGGELSFRVASLSLPPTAHASRPQLVDSEAVQLFVERAATALPGFALTDANASAIAQVCHRLDGIALAIELAAARVKTLKVEQIASRLDDTFRLLTGGSRTALPRQQTLRATIDWSYNLLSNQERNFLRRLSVFAGGWTLAAAVSVCSGKEVEIDEVLDLLTQLVNKSLVISEREQGEEARYRLLETIRQYALERLAASGEGESLRQQHAAFFMRLAEEAEPELRGPNQRLWNERLDGEYDNLRAALNWSLEHNAEMGVQLAGNLFWFWHALCYWSEGRAWYARLLAAGISPPGPLSLSSSARAQALCEAGWLALNDMEIDQALLLSEEGKALYRELGDTNGMAMALNTLGWVAYYRNDYDQAKALAEESLAHYRELGFKWRMAHLLNLLGNIARAQGDIESAMACYQESLTYTREIGDLTGIAYSLYVWGMAAWSQGDRAQAAPLFEESLTLAREIRVEWLAAYSLQTLGDMALAQSDYQRAAALYDECQALWERLGNKRELADLRPSQAWLARLQGNFQQAAALFREGLRSWQGVGDKRRIAACLEGLAGVAVAMGQVERAVRLFGAAEVIREVGGVPLPSVDRATYDRDIAAIHAQLGKADFIALWAEGRTLTMDQAIASALEKPPPTS